MTAEVVVRVVACFACAAYCVPAVSENLLAGFKDPEGGAIDLSQWLLDRKGFLPVPIVITEPC
jgi:hypothetical protein